LLRGQARARANGLTEVSLEDGTVLYSVDPAVGRVGLVVYPWEVSVGRQVVADSALNHVTAPISSLVPLGNRVRVRIGPLVAEVTTESAEQLALERGQTVVATFKATATRLVPLA
jgi:molybdopterin-binding protein